MKQLTFILMAILLLPGCGKHTTDSFGFTKVKKAAEGDKPVTTEDFFKLAINQNDKASFEQLLANETDFNMIFSDGSTPLIYATVGGKAVFVYLLIQAGAELSLKDAQGKTALDHAISLQRPRLELLLDPSKMAQYQDELFAGVVAKDSSGVPSGNVDTVTAKLKAGTDPNFINETRETPLTQAVLMKNLGMVKTIAKWKDPELGITKTDVNMPNAQGKKPLAIAKENNFTKIAEELVKQKAEE